MQHLLDRLLEPELGHTLAPWPTTLERTVRTLARAEGLAPADYLTRLGATGDDTALDRLLCAATVGHTAFMRHPEQLEYLKRVALPTLARHHGTPVRIWSAGCATGEEPYSIAACAEAAHVPVEILATDVNPEFLQIAREGRYPIRGACPAPLAEASGDEWVAPERFRRVIRFERASLAGSAPALGLGPFHIVFCRNVLIYFRPESTPEVVGRLLHRVREGGMLVVAPVEGVLRVPRPRLPDSPPGWFGADALAIETVAPQSGSSADRHADRDASSVARPSPSSAAVAAPPVGARTAIAGPAAGPPVGARTAAGPAAAPSVGAHTAAGAASSVAGPSVPAARPSPLEAAAALLEAGDADGAESLARTALDRNPADVPAWIFLGQLLLRRGEPTQARIAFLKAAEHAEEPLPEVA